MTEEDIIQMNIVNALRLKHPQHPVFAVPNGGHRLKGVARKLKATGTTPGVADLIFMFYQKTIFIEVKTDKGVQTKEQKAFQKMVTEKGHQYWVMRSAHQTLRRIEEFIYSGC